METTKDQNVEKKNELKVFESKLADQKNVIAENQKEKDQLLKETKSQEATYKIILKEKAATKAAFEKELFDFEAQLKFKLDPNSIPKAGTAVFSWPTDDVYITQLFGKTEASGRLYVSGSHNGVDFKALMGTPVKAVLSGVVIDNP